MEYRTQGHTLPFKNLIVESLGQLATKTVSTNHSSSKNRLSHLYCCRASARQLTNLDHPVMYEISDSRASLLPDLYICRNLDLCLFVCGDVRFPLNRIFFLEKQGGGGEKNKFGVCRAHPVFFHCSMCSIVYSTGNLLAYNFNTKSRTKSIQVRTGVSMSLFVSANTSRQ